LRIFVRDPNKVEDAQKAFSAYLAANKLLPSPVHLIKEITKTKR